MNGNETSFFNEKFNDLKNLVTEIKTENRVKWDEHNKRAKDLQEWLNKEFLNSRSEDKALTKLFNALPCDVQTEKIIKVEKEVVWNKRIYIGGIIIVLVVAIINRWMG